MALHNKGGNNPKAMFFAAYDGSSMNPTLREPEIIEIMPYDHKPMRVGDVAFFLSPVADQPLVHRIIRVTPAGISTRGDNNTQADTLLLQPKDIKGQVVAAWRGQKRRKIAGGTQGWLISHWLHWRGVLDRGMSPLLHPLYQVLSHWGLFARVLPAPFRPRLIVFQARGRDQFQLLLGQRIIGRYDDQKRQWQIQRPFQLFVDGKLLPRPHAKYLLNRKILNERQRIMNHAMSQAVRYYLTLADGSHWEIVTGDVQAASIVAQLGGAMQLRTTTGAIEPSIHDNLCQLLVQVDAHKSGVDGYVPFASENDDVVVCVLNPYDQWGGLYVNLVRLSLIFARKAQACGGVLIHGALVERDGMGVVLAGPGGTGKTTASNRLPAPWRSLCDDTTLVVRDPQGNYWAHPWPTWSRFLDGEAGGTWDVQRAVPVKGIFFLAQAVEDRVERIGSGQAVSLLVECAEQISQLMARGLSQEETRALHLERFNNICTLAQIVPAHLLSINLTGTFWQEIEQVLWGGHSKDSETRSGRTDQDQSSRTLDDYIAG